MILYVVEWVTGMIVLGFIFTQIARPLWRDTPLFPLFRSGKERELTADLKVAHQEIADMKLQLEVQATRKEAERLSRKVTKPTAESTGSTDS